MAPRAWGIGTGVPLPNRLRAGTDPGVEIGGHIAYGERRARAYNGGLGAVPPAGSRGRAPGQGLVIKSKCQRSHLVACISLIFLRDVARTFTVGAGATEVPRPRTESVKAAPWN